MKQVSIDDKVKQEIDALAERYGVTLRVLMNHIVLKGIDHVKRDGIVLKPINSYINDEDAL